MSISALLGHDDVEIETAGTGRGALDTLRRQPADCVVLGPLASTIVGGVEGAIAGGGATAAGARHRPGSLIHTPREVR